jgi:hypothetical protein
MTNWPVFEFPAGADFRSGKVSESSGQLMLVVFAEITSAAGVSGRRRQRKLCPYDAQRGLLCALATRSLSAGCAKDNLHTNGHCRHCASKRKAPAGRQTNRTVSHRHGIPCAALNSYALCAHDPSSQTSVLSPRLFPLRCCVFSLAAFAHGKELHCFAANRTWDSVFLVVLHGGPRRQQATNATVGLHRNVWRRDELRL